MVPRAPVPLNVTLPHCEVRVALAPIVGESIVNSGAPVTVTLSSQVKRGKRTAPAPVAIVSAPPLARLSEVVGAMADEDGPSIVQVPLIDRDVDVPEKEKPVENRTFVTDKLELVALDAKLPPTAVPLFRHNTHQHEMS